MGEFPGHGTADGKKEIGGRGQKDLVCEFFVQLQEENAVMSALPTSR